MEQITNKLLEILPSIASHGHWVYAIVVICAIIESTPVIGTFTPGTLFLLFFGYLASLGYGVLGFFIISVTVGAIIGDIVAYILGKYGKKFFKEHNKILKLGHLETDKAFFYKHGGKSVLIGRFVGVIRPIVPLIAGSVGMAWRRFLGWNILGALMWASLYVSLGYVFGSQYKHIEGILSHIGLVAAGVIFFAGIFYWKRVQMKGIFYRIFS